ncbi:MAG: hypothetical protein ACXWUN_06815 [Allosphingosinicella sp.]
MDDRDPERVIIEEPAPRVERETTVIHTGDRGGGSGVLIAVVLLILVVVGAFFFFGGGLEKAVDQTEINVNVETPDINLPDVDLTLPERPAEPASDGK